MVPRSAQISAGKRAAGEYLKQVLQRPGRPRDVWVRTGHDLKLQIPPTHADPLQRAISAAWMRYEYEYDIDKLSKDEIARCRSEGYQVGREMRRQLVSRALAGDMKVEVLERLITAFEIAPSDAAHLRGLWSGEGQRPSVEGTIEPDTMMPSSGLETLSLAEDHFIGPDGKPLRHETQQNVRALRDGIDHFPHYFDTNEVIASLIIGGTEGTVSPHHDSISVVHYTFPRPLMTGETHHFRYRLDFQYAEAPEPVYRREIHGHYRSGWDVHVFFDPARLPRKVWWTEWEHGGADSPIKHEELVPLDASYGVHRYLMSIRRAVAGFRWMW